MQRPLILLLALAACSSIPAVRDGQPVSQDAPILAVSCNRFAQFHQLVTMDAAGKNIVRLSNDPLAAGATAPSWSPDGKRLAFLAFRSGLSQIYVMNADGSDIKNITNTTTNEHQPAWSPDGKKIAFTSERTGNHDIFVMNADGSEAMNLTQNEHFDGDPAWSPDGKLIAFTSHRGRGFRLFLMNPDGSNQREVLDRDLGGWVSPTWSPDGKQLLFSGRLQDGSWQLFVCNTNGEGLEQLTDGPGVNSFSAWSPDNRFVAYLHFDKPPGQSSEGGRLVIMDLETGTRTEIAPDGMRCSGARPAWKPRQR